MPREAPVTSAVLPFRLGMFIVLVVAEADNFLQAHERVRRAQAFIPASSASLIPRVSRTACGSTEHPQCSRTASARSGDCAGSLRPRRPSSDYKSFADHQVGVVENERRTHSQE